MKTLVIEWKHLDMGGKTCARCSGTGEALQKVIGKLIEECKQTGWEIKFKETKLTEKNISESNVILFNGKPIEAISLGVWLLRRLLTSVSSLSRSSFRALSVYIYLLKPVSPDRALRLRPCHSLVVNI